MKKERVRINCVQTKETVTESGRVWRGSLSTSESYAHAVIKGR